MFMDQMPMAVLVSMPDLAHLWDTHVDLLALLLCTGCLLLILILLFLSSRFVCLEVNTKTNDCSFYALGRLKHSAGHKDRCV